MQERVNLDQFERYHAKKLRTRPAPASLKEIGWTLIVSVVVTPFFAALFLALPVIGQAVVLAALCLTLYYLCLRRSAMVLFSSAFGMALFTMVTGAMLQGKRFHPGIPLLFLLGFGLPVAAAFCLLVASRIWVLKGGRM